MTDSELALVHYRMKFPSLAAIGLNSAEKWQAEYDRVAAGGLAATLITSSGSDGGTTGAERNFDQKILLEALITVRAELDSAFKESVLAPSTGLRARALGIRLRY